MKSMFVSLTDSHRHQRPCLDRVTSKIMSFTGFHIYDEHDVILLSTQPTPNTTSNYSIGVMNFTHINVMLNPHIRLQKRNIVTTVQAKPKVYTNTCASTDSIIF